MSAHQACLFQKALLDLLIKKHKKLLLRRKMGVKGLEVNSNNKSSMESYLFKLFNSHYHSYDKNARSKKRTHPTPFKTK